MPNVPRRLLVPTDFSDLAREALRQAAALADLTGGELIVAHVTFEVPHMMPTGAVIADGRRDELVRDRDQAVAAEIAAEVEKLGGRVPTSSVVAVGDPATQLVALAEEHEVDLIVIASHGRTGLKRLLLGSVAEKVARHAPCGVLIAR